MLSAPVVLKDNHIQVVTDQFGDIPAGNTEGLGLYYYDTRYLSAYQILVNDQQPLYLSHSAERDYIATFQYVNPEFALADGSVAPRQSISIRRSRFADGRAFRERIGFYNCNHKPVDIELTLRFDADFRDMFAIRGFSRQQLAARTTNRFGPEGLEFTYVGRDHVHRHTLIRFSERPEPLSANVMLFRLRLEPHVPVSISLSVRPSSGRRKPVKAIGFDNALDRLMRSYSHWHGESTAFETDNDFFDQSLLRQSRYDIRALIEFDDEGQTRTDKARVADIVPSAGLPWYAVPFGRDSIITALQTLIYNPRIAVGTLRFLARQQGIECNDTTEEQPGKILHEIRRGELANLREIPHLPYYGSVDATPLFVVLLAETTAWVGSDPLYEDLLPHAIRALEWVDRYGDLDGDGYIEYIPHSSGGVRNQGWKDSAESLQYQDGRLAALPAALAEAQGYVYQAKMGLSRLMERHGDRETAQRLKREAKDLKRRFNQDFWMPAEGFYAQALDRDKCQIQSVTSNIGHCLWSGIIDSSRTAAVVKRLLAEDMFSGWGIRTLSSDSPNYNPMSYHNGSVWPHDNSIIAEGMRRSGYVRESATVISAMIEAGLRFSSNRLPEVFCGFPRDRRFNSRPVAYIKSCSPQAWAAGAPFLFLQTLLDIRPRAEGGALWIDPAPNDIFHCYLLKHLRVRENRISLEVRQEGAQMRVRVIEGATRVESPSLCPSQ